MEIREERGQASVEHLGVVALVAGVLLTAGAVSAVAAPGLLNRVTGGVQRALCEVTGRRCLQLEDEPCPDRRQTDSSSQGLSVSWLRLGHDRALFIERRSDGTYLLSLVDGGRVGAGIGRGASGRGVEASADASLTLGYQGGRQYVAATPEEARALVRRLRADPLPSVTAAVTGALDASGVRRADPAVDAYVLQGDAALEAVAKAGFGHLLNGGLEVLSTAQISVKVAAHRPELTVQAKYDGSISAFYDVLSAATLKQRGGAAAPAGGARAGAGGPVTVKNATPSTTLKGSVHGSLALTFGPGGKVLGAEVVVASGTANERRELRARLDPSEPAVARALAEWRAHPTRLASLKGLGAAAAQYAALDDRTFALVDQKQTKGLGGPTPSGVDLGLGLTTARSVGTLIEQRSRPSAGVWETRLDCGAQVAA